MAAVLLTDAVRKRIGRFVLAGSIVLGGSACAGTPRARAPASSASLPRSDHASQEPAELPFIENDYARAVVEARASKRPIFVDTWASWCHSCLSLRAFVFPDPKVRAYAKDFVWLAIDTERPENEEFVRTHPMDAWPTLWVIDPTDPRDGGERAILRWTGAATASELALLLEDAKLAVGRGRSPADDRDAEAMYELGNQETAAGKADLAMTHYRRALELAPKEWSKRARVLEALSSLVRLKKDFHACLDFAARALSTMPGGTSAKNVAEDALLCLAELPEADRRERADAVLAAAERIVRDPRQPLLADDRSELYGEILDKLELLGREGEAKGIARDWAALVEGEASRARTPTARAVFDAQRYEAYLALGEPERAIPMLRASERDFPDDYNPPARLAGTYLKLKRYDEGLAAVGRALGKAYGPRKIRLYALKADLCAAKGDQAGERAAVDAALAFARGMTLMGSQAKMRDALLERAKRLRQ